MKATAAKLLRALEAISTAIESASGGLLDGTVTVSGGEF